MRKLFAVGFIAFLLSPLFVYAQTGFVLGVAAGSVLGSSTRSSTVVSTGGDESHSADRSVIVMYLAPQLSERIDTKNILEIRQLSISTCPVKEHTRERNIGKSLAEYFSGEVQSPGVFEILQVVRIFRANNPTCVALWFSYIDKRLLKTLTPEKKK